MNIIIKNKRIIKKAAFATVTGMFFIPQVASASDDLENNTVAVTSERSTENISEFDIKKLNSIDIVKFPKKMTYVVGENFNPEGMEVILKDKNNNTKIVSYDKFEEEGISLNIPTNYRFTEEEYISLDAKIGYYNSYNIERLIRVKSIKNITISKAKSLYTKGEVFTTDGMEVIIGYSDRTTEKVQPDRFSDYGISLKFNSGNEITDDYKIEKNEELYAVINKDIVGLNEIKSEGYSIIVTNDKNEDSNKEEYNGKIETREEIEYLTINYIFKNTDVYGEM